MAGYVYLIGSPTFSWYKIGKSATPDTRVKQLGILLPFKIQVIALWSAENHNELERVLHEKYSSKRVNGEWFLFGRNEIKRLLIDMPKSIETATLLFSNLAKDAGPGVPVVKYKTNDNLQISIGPGLEKRIKELLSENKLLKEQIKALTSRIWPEVYLSPSDGHASVGGSTVKHDDKAGSHQSENLVGDDKWDKQVQ